MEQGVLLQMVAEKSGCSIEETRQVYQALVTVFAETLGNGEMLDCLPDWGRFIPKLRDNVGRQENSPRRLKKPHYYIQFKPSKNMEKQLFSCLEEDHIGGETGTQ